jgi:hypothetical protein
MSAVRNVASSGRTVMVTIHQPSIEIFEAFDTLLLLQVRHWQGQVRLLQYSIVGVIIMLVRTGMTCLKRVCMIPCMLEADLSDVWVLHDCTLQHTLRLRNEDVLTRCCVCR